jgi:hypothetical protein
MSTRLRVYGVSSQKIVVPKFYIHHHSNLKSNIIHAYTLKRETLVNIYQTTRRHNPKCSSLNFVSILSRYMSQVYNHQYSQEPEQIILNAKENAFQETLFSRVLNLVQICCVLYAVSNQMIRSIQSHF